MSKSLPVVLALFVSGLLSSSAHENSLPHHRSVIRANLYSGNTVCRTTPGFSRLQLELCYRYPEEMLAALQGIRQAVKECHYQFFNYRWNCSSLSTKTKNPYTSGIFRKGFRETAFAYAISSAGIAISVAKSCSRGVLTNCGCEMHQHRHNNTKGAWKWAGCSHNLHYGSKFSKMFFESKEVNDDIHSQVSLHNSKIGRMTVFANMQIKCKCHGLSGSCELKTCWKQVPNFHYVGKSLKEKFESAIQVDQANYFTNRNFKIINYKKKLKQRIKSRQWTPHKKKHKRGLKNNLLFYEKSPHFCDAAPPLDVWGTSGRLCSLNATDQSSCSSLCCGRGYNLVKQRRTVSCFCVFRWCCTVECRDCIEEKWISICK
ncbi:protein Wnt-10a isoform X2 [Tribolium castaneum]|uniref:protein Wnt-10a isoform X2 n=1 Tax=Tribolium castaneum TaxID=7070 RepID=UPI00077DC7ED|nr:PREDICTED: protein Wnt-10a isoform X2 [Tribolium castaneum]|eukprot:XP_015835532.1 PREDICTED: protein Wnt-10a isoform X2 [Tribolium castaneum]